MVLTALRHAMILQHPVLKLQQHSLIMLKDAENAVKEVYQEYLCGCSLATQPSKRTLWAVQLPRAGTEARRPSYLSDLLCMPLRCLTSCWKGLVPEFRRALKPRVKLNATLRHIASSLD